MQPDFSKLPGSPGNALLVPLALVRLMGSAPGALFLSQLLAWDPGDEGWQACSYAYWQRELKLSEYRVKKVTRWCAAQGFLEARVGVERGVPVTFYRLHLSALHELLASLLAAGGGEPGRAGAAAAAAWRKRLAGDQR
jgi:hypothetical protein